MDLIYILSRLKKIGLTQSQIAAEIGCSQPTISDMSAGKVGTARPSFKVVSGLHRLAEKYGITEGADPQPPAVAPQHRKDDLDPGPGHQGRQPPSRKNTMEFGSDTPPTVDKK